MTLVVALKSPCRHLNPQRRRIEFEPGIVIAADARYSDHSSGGRIRVRDDGVKLARFDDSMVAAFSGDCTFAQQVFGRASRIIESVSANSPSQRASIVQRVCRENIVSKRVASSQPSSPTEIILALRDSHSAGFLIRVLDSESDFEIRPWNGLYLSGSGKRAAESEFDRLWAGSIDEWKSESDRNSLFRELLANRPDIQSDKYPGVSLNLLAIFVTDLINCTVQSGRDPALGGLPQGWILGVNGIRPMSFFVLDPETDSIAEATHRGPLVTPRYATQDRRGWRHLT